MISQVANPVPFTRRLVFTLPLAVLFPLQGRQRRSASAATFERELIATVERDEGLNPPLTLGIARVVLRPGASALATTPSGARMIVVESGVLAVASSSDDTAPFTSAALAASATAPTDDDELFAPEGTSITFGSVGVARVRNPGARSVVALDVAVFREEPRPISRAFTTDEGISFQLLASASAAVAPGGKIALSLERVRLGEQSEFPGDLCRGLTLAYVEAGTIELSSVSGDVFAARAAASTPYSMPGSLQPILAGDLRGVTAGGVIFLPMRAQCNVVNVAPRTAEVLTLAVREVA